MLCKHLDMQQLLYKQYKMKKVGKEGNLLRKDNLHIKMKMLIRTKDFNSGRRFSRSKERSSI